MSIFHIAPLRWGWALPLLLAAMPASADDGRASLSWRDQSATMEALPGQHYRLRPPAGAAVGERDIAPQALRSETASVLFDGLFALAQHELTQNRVSEIRDRAFNHGQPIACDCYQTGEKWPYVWTRDTSYAIDLALARLDPVRSRNALRFKLSDVRAPGQPQGLYVAQDTGSGGSWPVSSDRVVWFLGARHLLDDPVFADETWRALRDTLAQDRTHVFDAAMGLYRGETSFLDWREQTYPAWTAKDVRFIAESYALSTNVLHYEALRLAESLARRHDSAAAATTYRQQAQALAQAIDARFWNAQRGMYMSYIGTAAHPVPFEAYDLLGISLAALSGAVPEARARAALANYPATTAGSPVIWPQQPGIAIYHNRAIWPFVSAYALRAARATQSPERIAHEIRSLMRGTALSGSNMENYEFITQATHVEDGALSGPVVNSPRQLWSVAGYIAMVLEGVFGLEADGTVAPQLPVELVPMLFGERDAIHLQLPDRRITLQRPQELVGDLLVADKTIVCGDETIVRLRARQVPSSALRLDAAQQFAPPAPRMPSAERDGEHWRIRAPGASTLYVDGQPHGPIVHDASLPARAAQQCLSVTRTGADGVESLHSPTLCLGDVETIGGDWPRRWTAPRDGRYRALLRYDNRHGPINTGITAAVKQLSMQCGNDAEQASTVTMPHSVGEQDSTRVAFQARAGQACTFVLRDGFNMSYLRHFARYTGGEGGAQGPLNDASIGVLEIAAER